MVKSKRIIFYGTPDFAVSPLKHLVDKGYNIVAVVTATDKPAGRGQKLRMSKVKEYALEENIQVLQPNNLKSQDFIQSIEDLNPDLQIVIAFRMMPKEVFSIPPHGTFNLHASLLPKYRGAAPIHWAVINGEKETGLTTFFLNEKIDEGEIILQDIISIGEEETTGELYTRLMNRGGDLVKKTIDLVFAPNLTTIPQSETGVQPSEAPKLGRDNTEINWQENGRNIVDFIRGLSPFPCAYSSFSSKNTDKSLDLKVFRGVFREENHKNKLGKLQVVDNKEIRVYCSGGYVQLLDIQQAGKRRMRVDDFLRGARLDEIYYSD